MSEQDEEDAYSSTEKYGKELASDINKVLSKVSKAFEVFGFLKNWKSLQFIIGWGLTIFGLTYQLTAWSFWYGWYWYVPQAPMTASAMRQAEEVAKFWNSIAFGVLILSIISLLFGIALVWFSRRRTKQK